MRRSLVAALLCAACTSGPVINPAAPAPTPDAGLTLTVAQASPGTAIAGAPVVYTGTVSGAVHGELAWTWLWSDGTRDTAAAQLAKTFPAAGDYTGQVRVVDSDGRAAQASIATTV